MLVSADMVADHMPDKVERVIRECLVDARSTAAPPAAAGNGGEP